MGRVQYGRMHSCRASNLVPALRLARVLELRLTRLVWHRTCTGGVDVMIKIMASCMIGGLSGSGWGGGSG